MACACSEGLFNSGRSGSKELQQPSKLILVHKYDKDGAVNKITAAEIESGIDDTFVDGKINNTDPLARWYPIGVFKDQTNTRGDAVFQDFNDGTSEYVRENPRAFTGMLTSVLPLYLPRINYWKCSDFGIFEIDDCGNINGMIDAATGDLLPIPVNAASWHAAWEPKNNEAKSRIMLSFQLNKLFQDSTYRSLEEGTDVTANMIDKVGLLDLKATEVSAPTTTTFAVKITRATGKEWNPTVATGLTDSDFVLRNTTTASVVTPSDVTEAPDGTYTFTYAAQTSADVLTITYIGSGLSLEPFKLTPVA